MSKETEFVTTVGINMPPGTVFSRAPTVMKYCVPHYSVILALGKDHTAELIISEDAIRDHPQLFTELKNTIDITNG